MKLPMRWVAVMLMLGAALLGGHLLGEADRGPRLLGAACMATGVVLLAW